jgi:hypothetical protein
MEWSNVWKLLLLIVGYLLLTQVILPRLGVPI